MYDAWLDEHVDYHDPDENENEWDGDAENEPQEVSEMMRQMIEDEELAEWARALMEEDEEPIYELKPGMVRCLHRMRHTGNQCQLAAGHVGRHAWEPAWVERVAKIEAASDKFTERDEAPLVKPEGPCATLEAHDGVMWDV